MSEAADAARPRISAAVICLDEERNIGACLESLAWCDEIVVVDSGSRDRTVEIARKHATRVLHHAWAGYVAQKNWAFDQTSGEWVFCVDADERCTPALRAAIERALDPPTPMDLPEPNQAKTRVSRVASQRRAASPMNSAPRTKRGRAFPA